jgi:DNA helicase-2/ATP-dependent DNA helicase PcrA
VLNLLPGIGVKRASRLSEDLADATTSTGGEAEGSVPSAAISAWTGLSGMMARLRSAPEAWPRDIHSVAEWYLPLFNERYGDVGSRWSDIEALLTLAESFGSRQHCLAELTLDVAEPDEISQQTERLADKLTLSTIHAAKGREWEAVYVLSVADGYLPVDLALNSEEEIEEERRLLYVAMTRARKHLHVLVPRRFRGTGDVYVNRSRFIPDVLLKLFDRRHGRRGDEVGPTYLDDVSRRADLPRDVRRMWR